MVIKFEDIVKGDKFTMLELYEFHGLGTPPGFTTGYSDHEGPCTDICIEQAGVLWHFRLHANEDKWVAMNSYLRTL